MSVLPPTQAWTGPAPAQQPDWPDPARLELVLAELAGLPPLVFAGECEQLRSRLAAVTRGEAFVLQGGDCAETFAGATADGVRAKLQTILQMAVVLTYGASVPIVKIGRLAGQYAKPRSRPAETRAGVELPAYRGDAVNGFDFTAADRAPDPDRLLRAYHCAAVTLNLCRAFTTGGYADLHQVHAWNQDFVRQSPAGQRYERPGQARSTARSPSCAPAAPTRTSCAASSSTPALFRRLRVSSWPASSALRKTAFAIRPGCYPANEK